MPQEINIDNEDLKISIKVDLDCKNFNFMQNDIKGAIGEGIGYIVLKYLGLNPNKPALGGDDKGDDLQFRKKIGNKTYSLYIQVKTTENIENGRYALNVKNYNDYTGLNNEGTTNVGIILIVEVLQEDLINITEENFTTYCKLYWYKPQGELSKNGSSVSIEVGNNQITNENLNNILQQWVQ